MKNIRNTSLETMKTELSDHLKCEIQKQDIVKKMHTLKLQFQREISAVKASQKSGARANDVYVPKLWCYDELSFLADGVVIHASTSNLEQTSSTQQIDEAASPPGHDESSVDAVLSRTAPSVFTPAPNPSTAFPGTSPSPTPSTSLQRPAKRKQKETFDQVITLPIDKLSSGPTQRNLGPALNISNLVYNKLSAMEAQQRIIAKKLITEVLSLGEIGLLTMDHNVVKATFSDEFMA